MEEDRSDINLKIIETSNYLRIACRLGTIHYDIISVVKNSTMCIYIEERIQPSSLINQELQFY